MNKKIQKFYVMVLAILALMPSTVMGAEIFFNVNAPDLKTNQLFTVDVFVNSSQVSINALQGTMLFPSELVTVRELNYGGSVINFWLEKPTVSHGAVTFSGIIPGGYKGKQGLLYSVALVAHQSGDINLQFKNIEVFRNDGSGTAEATISPSKKLMVVDNLPNAPVVLSQLKINHTPPEPFTPQLAHEAGMFNGQWFLVFATQDKGSGIDHYEIKEGGGSFLIAESPYQLFNQQLDADIIIKAVDKKGNERTVTLPSATPATIYKNYAIYAIIILILLATVIYLTNRWGVWKKLKK